MRPARPSRAARAPSTSASSRRARTTRRSRACSSRRTPTTRWSACCWPARSTGEALGNVGGDVPACCPSAFPSNVASFGSFVPATARTYETAMAATVVSTAGDAKLSVTDASSTAPGHLVNQAFSLPSALQVRAANAAQPNPAYVALSETAGTAVDLLTYSRRPRARTRSRSASARRSAPPTSCAPARTASS